MAWLLGGLLALVLPAFTVLVFMNRKDYRETMAMRDLLDATKEQLSVTRGELLLSDSALKVKTDECEHEHKLRIEAEADRNSAFVTVRKQIVEHIKNARTTTDANRLVADLLSMSLGVQAMPEAGRATAPGPDALIDPFADVQSP